VAAGYQANIRNSLITVPHCPAGARSSWHLFPVLTPPGRKQEFMGHLASRGIGSGEHYPSVLADQPAMKQVPFEERGLCGNARDFCSREVSLPIHPQLTDSEVARVADACNDWR
jgi:dTDP-3-amino-3,4,6-trideoxy-alpha-D-glucose transaminase